jgi:hypothetical protein
MEVNIAKEESYYLAQNLTRDNNLEKGTFVMVYNGQFILHDFEEQRLYRRSISYLKISLDQIK